MANLPEEGKFKISAVGPMKSGTAKSSGRPYKIFSLQFENDQQWYDTYWANKEDPTVGEELEGKKEYDEKFDSYKFTTRRNNTNKFNPAAAQATVMLASVTLLNGFLQTPEGHELYTNKDPKLGAELGRYVKTVESISKNIKEMVISMGALSQETKTEEKTTSPPPSDGDPGPTPPPELEGVEEDVNIDI